MNQETKKIVYITLGLKATYVGSTEYTLFVLGFNDDMVRALADGRERGKEEGADYCGAFRFPHPDMGRDIQKWLVSKGVPRAVAVCMIRSLGVELEAMFKEIYGDRWDDPQ